MRLTPLVTLGSLLFAGPTLATEQGAASLSGPNAAVITPLVDHHAHIYGPVFAQNGISPILPAVEVPPHVATLLHALGTTIGDQKALAQLYAEDSLMVKSDMRNWVQGREINAAIWTLQFRVPYTLVPIAYQGGDSTAYVVAYLARGEGPKRVHQHTVLLALKKEKDNQWRVAAEMLTLGPIRRQEAVTAKHFVEELDAAGIQKATILSVAFVLAGAVEEMAGEAAKVRAENDWVAKQAALYPGRLTAFCSLNPLKNYALKEVASCGADPLIKGLKFHFADSGVNLRDPQHLAKVRKVFEAANRHKLAITAHIMTRESDYDGRATATAFLNHLLPAVPDVPVQIAHMTGDSFFGTQPQAGFAVFADAIAARDPRTRRLYFDASVGQDQPAENLQLVAAAMRRVGFDRILFASDRAAPNNSPPGVAWNKIWREKLPLSESEFRDIADNVVVFRD
ncbi:MAG: amidohydrolase family protein [Chloroflexi bacterium]|nr:amidohydrolase family protein [Chloroflexota bacterium]